MSRIHELLQLAQEIASDVPPSLADGMAVIGSVSIEKADQYSDVDLALWVETYPELATCREWIDSLDANLLRPLRVLPDSSIWFEFTYHGKAVNLTWASWELIEARMQVVRDVGQHGSLPPDNEFMLMHWIMKHAIILRDHSHVQPLKREVALYPEALRHNIIKQHIAIWERMIKVSVTFSGFSVGKRGELPDTKWLLSGCVAMPDKPRQLEKRIRSILTEQDIGIAISDQFDLLIDTLLILEGTFDVKSLFQPLQAIRDGIR